jgi:antitoxin component of RelBE/YafQ-DinJ toxin-antitoxin module
MKKREQVLAYVDEDTKDKIVKHCAMLGISESALIKLMIHEYFKNKRG